MVVISFRVYDAEFNEVHSSFISILINSIDTHVEEKYDFFMILGRNVKSSRDFGHATGGE